MLCKILKSFPGSQDGRFCEQFHAGTEADLSEYLIAAADPSWFERITTDPVIENKAFSTDGQQTGKIPLRNKSKLNNPENGNA